MWISFLQVGFGGALGAMMRYGVGLAALRTFGTGGFPVAVLAVNILGSFLMGLALVLILERGVPQFGPFLMTGILGGFTTFSAFSLEAFTLYERGDVGQAAIYVAASVIVSIVALVLGVMLARSFLP